MELTFPIEFLVHGTAVSQQAKRATSRATWREQVRNASTAVIPQPHFASNRPIAVTLYYLLDQPMPGDLDNIVKPILDALSRHIYLDDSQIERIVVQKFKPNVELAFKNASSVLSVALAARRPVLYVRLSDQPMEEHQ
jgi:Holliday junction resolvase RusA-like endonuclease